MRKIVRTTGQRDNETTGQGETEKTGKRCSEEICALRRTLYALRIMDWSDCYEYQSPRPFPQR